MLNSQAGLRCTGRLGVKTVSGNQISQVRYRRQLAYPQWTQRGGAIPPTRGKRKQTVPKRLMDEFLGPKNFKGDYYLNNYAYVNQDHKPNYIDPRKERGSALLTRQFGEDGDSRRPKDPLQPFPGNRYCRTNVQVSKETKKKIVNDIVDHKMSAQNAAIKYGLKIQRIEAIVKLNEIETAWEEEGKITADLRRMGDMMYKLFPVNEKDRARENLTEIPIPKETKDARFLTIAESEPFGPVDAAREFGLEPAAETLRKLSEVGEHAQHTEKENPQHKSKTFIAPMREGDRSAFRFTDVKVGQVGYRYGKPFRDMRRDRKIAFDNAGNVVYPVD